MLVTFIVPPSPWVVYILVIVADLKGNTVSAPPLVLYPVILPAES